jgi:4-hydroxy-tetrahydrodipicolinate synthase
VITALVTPFSSEGEIVEDSIRELVRFQLKSGIHGIFALGTNGMGPAMEPQQRKRVAEIVVSETAGRVPVIVHVGAVDPRTGIELAAHAQKIGATAIASVTPFYYHPDPQAFIEHYRKLAESTTLPVLVYNIPGNTGNNLNAETVARLSKIPGVVGIKDSTRDFSQLLDYLSIAPPGFNVISGTESFLFSALCAGAHGGVSGLANAFPEIMVRLYENYQKQNFTEAKQIQLKIHSLRSALTKPEIAPFLETLKMRGLKSGKVKPPLRSMTTEEVQTLYEFLRRALPEIEFTL